MRKKGEKIGSQKLALAVLGILLVSVFGVSLPSENTIAANDDMYGGTLKIAVVDEPSDNIYPMNATGSGDLDVLDLLYDSLAMRDVKTGEILPWLADTWTIDENQVTVQLKEGVKFWDGTEMTSVDVKYSYENYEGPLTLPVEDYNASDDYTIRFTLSDNNPAFFMSDGLMVPIIKNGTADVGTGPFMDYSKTVNTGEEITDEKVREATKYNITRSELNLVFDNVYQVELYGTLQLPENETERERKLENYTEDYDFIADHPVMWDGTYFIESGNYTLDKSTGKITDIYIPYMTEITANYKYNMTTCSLSANEDYFNGRPYLDALEFKVFKTIAKPKSFNADGIPLGASGSAATHMTGAVNRLANGEIDVIKPVYPSIYSKYIDSSESTLVKIPKNEFVYASYKADILPTRVGENNVTEEKADQFRNAVNYLYARDNIVSNFLQGMGYKGITVVSPGNKYWFNKDTSAVKQDVSKANEMMDEISYMDYDADGVRELPNHEEFSIDVKMPGITVDENPSVVGSELAGDDGLNALSINNSASIMTSISQLEENEEIGNFSITINRYEASLDPGKDMYDLFHTNGTENFMGFSNKELDHQIRDANAILDMDERQTAISELQDTLLEKMPMSVIYFPTQFHVYRKDTYTGWVNGFDHGPHNKQTYLNVHKMVEESLTLSITMKKSLESGEETTITVLAKDQSDNVAPGVEVDLEATLGDLSLATSNETTDNNGQIQFTYNAPEIERGFKDIVFTVKGVKGVNIGSAFFMATLHPEEKTFSLDVDLDRIQMASGGVVNITVEVRGDFEDYPVVKLTLIPSSSAAWLDETNNEGNTGEEFTTTLHVEGLKTDTRFTVKASATYQGVTETDDGSISVSAEPPEEDKDSPGFTTLALITAVITTVVVNDAVRRKRNK
ncbi:MAG: ABC transporter substrate-binding protein [Thermoplasmata archaeon]